MKWGRETCFLAAVVMIAGLGIIVRFVWENDTPYKVKPAGRLTFSQVNPFNAFADARSFMTPLLQSRQYRDPARKKAFWNTAVQMMLPPSVMVHSPAASGSRTAAAVR